MSRCSPARAPGRSVSIARSAGAGACVVNTASILSFDAEARHHVVMTDDGATTSLDVRLGLRFVFGDH